MGVLYKAATLLLEVALSFLGIDDGEVMAIVVVEEVAEVVAAVDWKVLIVEHAEYN